MLLQEGRDMKNLGRWKCSDAPSAEGVPFPTAPAPPLLEDQEIDDDAPRSRQVRQTHIYLDGWAPIQPPTASRTRDAAPALRPVRRGDQGQEPGQLICRLMQQPTGDWGAVDGNNQRLTVTRGSDGVLEVRHAPSGEAEDPDVIRVQAPVSHDPNAARHGDSKAFERRMSAALSPSRDADQNNPRSIRGLSALLASHYRRA
jgi:hypothetical protein